MFFITLLRQPIPRAVSLIYLTGCKSLFAVGFRYKGSGAVTGTPGSNCLLRRPPAWRSRTATSLRSEILRNSRICGDPSCQRARPPAAGDGRRLGIARHTSGSSPAAGHPHNNQAVGRRSDGQRRPSPHCTSGGRPAVRWLRAVASGPRDSHRESSWAAVTQWRAKTGRQATARPSGGGDPMASGARPKVSASTTSTSAKLAGERSGLLKKDACLPDACAPDY